MLWSPGDTKWIGNIRRVVSGEETLDPPETGFFNAGQKAMFWEIVAGCIVYLITGIILWMGARNLRRDRGGYQLCAARYLRHNYAWVEFSSTFI